jgi:hypothetical protein
MAHFAKLDSNNTVIHISVVDNENLLDDQGTELEEIGIKYLTQVHGYSNWKQTSYNGSFRGSYAAIGDTYDPELDIFIQPKPFPSWVLNKSLKKWEAPVPKPEDGNLYVWSEETQSWIEDVFEQEILKEISESLDPKDLIDGLN